MKNLLILILLFSQSTAFSQSWQLVWEDDFNSQSAFHARWDVYHNHNGHGKKVLMRNENVNLTGGILHITTKKEVSPISYNSNESINPPGQIIPNWGAGEVYPITSGWVSLKPSSNIHYGRIEARIKLQGHIAGYWPAFWTWKGEGIVASNPNKPANEIDIFEMDPYLPSTKITTNYHYQYDDPATTNNEHLPNPDQMHHHIEKPNTTPPFVVLGNPTESYSLPINFDYADTWHTYRMDWSPNSLKWYVDGTLIRVVLNHSIVDPSRIILSAVVKSSAITSYPYTSRTMEVDWVRFYEKTCGAIANVSGAFAGDQDYVDNIYFHTNAMLFDHPLIGGSTAVTATNKITMSPSTYIAPTGQNVFHASIDPDMCINLKKGNSDQVSSDEITQHVKDDNLSHKLFNIYPNPNVGQFTIELFSNEDNVRIEVCDLMGKQVFNSMMNATSKKIDISAEPEGIYLVKIIIGNKVINEKIVYQ
ncbi:MAG: hypothetical protein COB15_01770 [Flavobacteriales bacterium]|nr:MAG: hypothetical protein COB15_01770 [Flavobacteriales bacterium]